MRSVGLLPALAVLLVACGADTPPQAPPPVTPDEPATTETDGPLVIAAPAGGRALTDVIDAWRQESGERARLVSVDTPERKEADLFVSDSVGDIWSLAEDDELRPVSSAVVNQNIDVTLRDSESRWVGISTRARIVAYNEAAVTPEELASVGNYASLRDERWLGRLCLSSSRSGGNRMVIAQLIREHGVREAEMIVRGWRANLATTVYADDDALLAAIAAGDCAIGIAGSNRIFAIPGSSAVGAHWFEPPATTVIDAAVLGISRHATDADGAQRLLEWLTTPTANALFAIGRLDLPANSNATIATAISDLPVDRGSASAPLSELAFLLEEADLLRQRAGYP